jgi:Flp pilus assembly protein TadB
VLSDHERKALREVERQFLTEDPRFTRSFEARQTQLTRQSRKPGAGLAVWAAALLAALVLVAGSLAGALAIAFATSLLWTAWRHSGDRRTP